MSPDDPTLPPEPPESGTLPAPPPSYGDVPPIPKGEAQAAFSAALDDLSRAYLLVEALGMAACRALDEASKDPTTP